MANDDFFLSALGACVIQLSSAGHEVSFRKIREIWQNNKLITEWQSHFFLSELSKIEGQFGEQQRSNVLQFRKRDC